MKDLAIYGASGFGMEVAFLVEDINKCEPVWNILGYVDDAPAKWGKKFYGYSVLGGREYLAHATGDLSVAVAIGGVEMRRKVVAAIRKPHIDFPVLIHPNVVMSRSVDIGPGSIVCAGSILTVEISIGEHVHINLDCTIGHEVTIQEYSTLYPSVSISGNVKIGSNVSVGTGTHIIQGISVGEHAVLGAGAVVVRDIPSGVVAVGNPARPIGQT